MIIGIFDNTGMYGDFAAAVIQHRLSKSRYPLVKWLETSHLDRNTYSKRWLIKRFDSNVNKVLSIIFNIPFRSLESGKMDTVIITVGTKPLSIAEIRNRIRMTLHFNLSDDIWINSLIDSYSIPIQKDAERFIFDIPVNQTNWIISDVKYTQEKDRILSIKDSTIINLIFNREQNSVYIGKPREINITFATKEELIQKLDNLI